MMAASCSMQPFGEPGVLQMMACPRMPAMPRESRPSGLTNRIASASPGASRSMTARVPSGVWSRGANPVPPVLTTRPANPSAIAVSAADEAGALTAAGGSRDTRRGAPPARAPLSLVLAAAILGLLCVEWVLTQRGRLH